MEKAARIAKPLDLTGAAISLTPLLPMLPMLSIVTGRDPRKLGALAALKALLCSSTLTQVIAIVDSFLHSEPPERFDFGVEVRI